VSAEFFSRLVFNKSAKPNDDHVLILAVVSGYLGKIVGRYPGCRLATAVSWHLYPGQFNNTRSMMLYHKGLRDLMVLEGHFGCVLEYRLRVTLRAAVRYLSRKSPILVDGHG